MSIPTYVSLESECDELKTYNVRLERRLDELVVENDAWMRANAELEEECTNLKSILKHHLVKNTDWMHENKELGELLLTLV